MRLRYVLSTGYFPFLVCQGKDSEGNKGFRPVREAFPQRAWTQSESLALRVVRDEEFLHTKININDVYLDYGATEDIPEDACCFTCSRGIIMDEDLTALTCK